MKFVRAFLIFSYGLFTIGAQTLLFREFITSLEGNDISVGLFFFSWFLWIALGALFIDKAGRLADAMLSKIWLLFLLYLPAFVIQWVLIVQARQLAQIQTYELPSVQAMLLLSVLVNAPLSLLTGILFPLSCRWFSRQSELAVSRVYILESAGSFCGGLVVTILLAVGLSSVRVFAALAFILTAAILLIEAAKTILSKLSIVGARLRIAILFLLCVSFPVGLYSGIDRAFTSRIQKLKWSKLLPGEAFAGSFRTAQAEYLYGNYQDQMVVVREGSTVEALWDHATYGQIAAMVLCQKPDAEKVLVVGSGLGLCREFLRMEQIQQVGWAYYDDEYPTELEKIIPESMRISDERLNRIGGDIRRQLASKSVKYDIVIANLPDATNSVLSRYYTIEFYNQIKTSLTEQGVLAVRVSGGENVMGTELVNLGASVKNTLEAVFENIVLVPGEESWFLASDSQRISGEPGLLKERFARIEGAVDVFEPSGLLSVYQPDRAAKALWWYAQADLPERLLINKDKRAFGYLYSLLLAAKQSGAPVTKVFKQLATAGPVVFVIPLAVFVLLRLLYVFGGPRQGKPSSFESSFVVFSAGWAAIGTVVALMYLYQTYFGLLYLHIGIISSLFMVGLTVGASVIRNRLKVKSKADTHQTVLFFLFVLAVHILVMTAIIVWPDEQKTQLFFAGAFAICGLCSGCYFPVASRCLEDSGIGVSRAGTKLEMSDHLGASVGGILSSLAIIPVLGIKWALIFMLLLLTCNIPSAIALFYRRREVLCRESIDFRLRCAGYILLGIGASVILCSNILVYSKPALMSADMLRVPTGQGRLEKVSVSLDQQQREITCYKLFDEKGAITGYVFNSADFAPDVRGFGGEIDLSIYVDSNGKLQDFQIVRSNETPDYLSQLDKWMDSLKGCELFKPDALADVDVVTGATISSAVIITALEKSGERFYTHVLGSSPEESAQKGFDKAIFAPDAQAVYLVSAVILMLLVIYFGGFRSRIAVLVFNFVVGGIILNAQYSSEQIVNSLSLRLPAFRFYGPLLLILAVPILIALLGNIYCGYLCPFGAAQELLGCLIPARFKQGVSIYNMKRARFVKYVLLFILVAAFFITRDHDTISADPLISIFSGQASNLVLSITAVAAVGSLFYIRFWCCYLCPAGAFLSLFNNFVLLKHFVPAKRFVKCEFGLSGDDKMDCIYCDRCRHEAAGFTPVWWSQAGRVPKANILNKALLPVVIVVALFIAGVAFQKFSDLLPAGSAAPAVSATPTSAGRARDLDTEKIRRMIRQGKLSDKEAQFYEKSE